MNPKTLYDKLFDSHVVHVEEDGTALIYIDRHLVHEVTSPQAFEGLRMANRPVRRPDATVAVADHNTPTTIGPMDEESRIQVETLEKNVADLQKLLELKNQQLAQLEKKAAPAAPAPAAKAPEPADLARLGVRLWDRKGGTRLASGMQANKVLLRMPYVCKSALNWSQGKRS